MNARSNVSSSGQRLQRVERRADSKFDAIDNPGCLPVRRPILVHSSLMSPAQHAARRREAAGDAQRGVAGERADLDGTRRSPR